MELRFEQIKQIVTGASQINEENGAVRLNRFTEQQESLYKRVKPEMYDKVCATAGIKLSFKTNSETLFLKIKTAPGCPRQYFSVDVFANGKLVDCLDNFTGVEIPAYYTVMELPLGEFSKSFSLGPGEKTVAVHLPWSTSTLIEQISVDDGAFVEGVKPEKKLLVYGDSITQGYDALRPSNRYISKLADKLGAEEYNKAIGGEIFFPELAEYKDDFKPDYILVSYGSNDWNRTSGANFKSDCAAFYKNLIRIYPEAKIFALTPLWRKDLNEEREFGDFLNAEKGITEAVKDLDNVVIISGFDFVPHDEKYFADLRLHPNDEGFEHFFKSLYSKVEKEL